MDSKTAQARGLQPLARLVGYPHTGPEPKNIGMGPVSATRLVLEKTGLSVNDLDVIEANEAFAAQACAPRNSAWTRPRSTLTARAFRWVTRLAPPAR
jgi:acetyl-CoA acetyltransferase